MEPEGSLPHSQEPTTWPYPRQIYPIHAVPHFLKIHFNIIFPSTPRFLNWPLSIRSPHQNPVGTSLPHMCYILRPSPSCCHPNNIWLIHIIKASCTMGTGCFPGVKSGRGVTLTPHPLLVPWSSKGRAIPLLPLWTVRPVQSLSACIRVHFTFYLTYNKAHRSVVFSTPLLPRPSWVQIFP